MYRHVRRLRQRFLDGHTDAGIDRRVEWRVVVLHQLHAQGVGAGGEVGPGIRGFHACLEGSISGQGGLPRGRGDGHVEVVDDAALAGDLG